MTQEVERRDGERPQRPLELVAVPGELAADEAGALDRVARTLDEVRERGLRR